jgi:Na+/proline symporter
MNLHLLDHIVVIGYLAFSVGLGFAMRKQASRDEFFSAGHSMGRVTVGLSVMATLFSANSFVMYPSVAYGDSLRIALALVAFWAMSPLVIHVFIPVYAKLNCATAYEYLEQRFHVSVRSLASGLFILLRIAWMASATFAASVAIAGISGVDQITIIVSLGAVSILYTMLGGLRAVMWTDVLQFFVFAGTILFATALLINQSEGALSGMLETYFIPRPPLDAAGESPGLLFDFSLDPTFRFGTIAVLIGSILEGLSAFGADQVAVQRYISAKDVRTSQAGFRINLLGMMIVIPGLLLIGAGLFSYFEHHPEDLAPVLAQKIASGEVTNIDGIPDADSVELITAFYTAHPELVRPAILKTGLQDQALSQFVRLKFPPGVVGLLIAALMAATMSSIDSGIHSVTTAIVIDFRDRLFPWLRPNTDAGEMRMARILLVVIGVIAVTLACFVGQFGDVFAVAKKTTSAFGGPLLAVFVLGLFFRRASTVAVFIGTLSGAGLTMWMIYAEDEWFSMWFWPLGFFSAIGIALFLSWIPFVRADSTEEPLTFWAVRDRSE